MARLSGRLAAVGGRIERVECDVERKGMALGDKRAEAARDPGELVQLDGSGHGWRIS